MKLLRIWESALRHVSLIACSAVALCASPCLGQSKEAPNNNILHPGDAIRIVVWRKPDLSGDLQIAADGSLKHPLYKDVKVTGVPFDTVDARLRSFLLRFETDPQFIAEPLLRVAVAGEVRKPDLYALPAETTIAQALALAGGATENGRLDRVILLRDGQQRLVDLLRPEVAGADIPIRSGDSIVVPHRSNFFRDALGPAASVLAASAALITVIRR